MTFSGRSKTADLIDSYLVGKLSFAKGTTLKTIIETVLKDLNLNIQVKETLSVSPFSEVVSAKRGDKALDFILKYARKKQVLVTNDGDGNILITQSGEKITDTIEG